MGSILIHRPTVDFDRPPGDGGTEGSTAGVAGSEPAGLRTRVRDVAVGFRTEGNWQSWLRVLDRWSGALAADGARCSTHLGNGPRVGGGAAGTTAGVAGWAADLDVVFSGLGTCGSCTSYTVIDAITAAQAGARAVAVVTEEFAPHARSIAAHLGRPDLPLLVLPHPMEGRDADDLDAIADQYYAKVLDRIGGGA